MKIKSFVGGHSIKVFSGCEFDPRYRKFTGGTQIGEIPFSGRMLNAKIAKQESSEVDFEGFTLTLNTPQEFEDVDPIPSADECDFCIVSAMYVAACKAVGADTSRLLTIGGTVVDENGSVIGACSFNRN